VIAYQLAQMNIGRLRAPVHDPLIDDFRNALGRINAVADAQPGFVWRLTAEGVAPGVQTVGADPTLAINISVWESVEPLAAFAYRTEHREFVRRRLEWFEPPSRGAIYVLWGVPAGHRPSIEECFERLGHLRANGPSPHAFDFKQRFEAPGQEEAAA
jgi:hypothetical protein